MCDIWRGTTVEELSYDVLVRQLDSVADLKVEWVVFSGGEPLMHPDIFRLCQAAKEKGARVTVLSTGLLLERFAAEIIRHVDDVIVSLDGPEQIHDVIRRVPGTYAALAAGVMRLRELNPNCRINGRCTVQRSNCESLLMTVSAARELGLDSLSFLAVDVHSTAFNRPGGLKVLRQSQLSVAAEQIPLLESQIEAIIAQGYCGNFVMESPAKLRRIAHHFRCDAGLSRYVSPACNAPWKSAVIEANGAIRPCFFHPAFGTLKPGQNLRAILNSPSALEFRLALDVPTNPICRRCVCSLNHTGATTVAIHPITRLSPASNRF
jgi:MoaA/NifB/PqqE/SkfB family radical SAM enzyme